jgi:alkylation response protein AidB-like acyl-CoA dehydrogenase
MDFQIAEEDKTVAELAREILADRVDNELLKGMETEERKFDADLWRALAEANLLGVAIPEAHGGMELGFFALGLLMQEVGRSVAPVPVYGSLVLGALPLAEFGSEADKAEWLPKVAAGVAFLTAALIELDSSDPLRPSTRADKRDGGYRLSGEKTLVPGAEQADRILVAATADSGEIVLAWVDPSADGVRIEAQQASDRQPYAHLALDGVVIGDDALLGGASGGAERLRWLVEHASAARCMMQLGVTERALEMTAEYGGERIQFERPIGSFQAFHQRAADAYIMIEAVRLSAWEAVWRLAHGLDARESVAVAKYWAAEGGQFAAYACQHLHGGIGIDTDYPLHRYFIWATQIEHELGAAPYQLEKLGAQIAEHGVPEF